MDFEDSGIDSDPKATSPKEPIITFSPEKARFEKSNSNNIIPSSSDSSSNNNGRSHTKKSTSTTTSSSDNKRKKRLPGGGGCIEDEVEIRSSSASDRRGLIPPSRLAIPSKSQPPSSNKDSENSTTTFEHKPLVQWGDSDESEDELSFFPGNKAKRGVLTDNLSIDNLSLEDGDEEEDLHLTPPARPPLRTRCPDLLSAPCNRGSTRILATSEIRMKGVRP